MRGTFAGAAIVDTRFCRTHFNYTVFKGVALGDAVIEAAVFLKCNLEQGALPGMSLAGIDLTHSKFLSADLQGIDFSKAILTGCNFSKANLSGASLRKASAASAFFGETNLAGADLTGADLRGAGFAGASLQGARFDSAQLNAARFVRSTAGQTSFAGADLSYADFSYCLLDRAIMTDAITEKTNLHGVADAGVVWTKRQLATAIPTDQDRYEADTWAPPP